MHQSALYQWTIKNLLEENRGLILNNPKFFFIKPESLCIADRRWVEKIYLHQIKRGIPKKPKQKSGLSQLLLFEVNGQFVHENLSIQPNEIKSFKAINQENYEDLDRDKIISYYTASL